MHGLILSKSLSVFGQHSLQFPIISLWGKCVHDNVHNQF